MSKAPGGPGGGDDPHGLIAARQDAAEARMVSREMAKINQQTSQIMAQLKMATDLHESTLNFTKSIGSGAKNASQ